MTADDLFDCAMHMMRESYDLNPGQGDTDLAMLVEDIVTAEGGDEDDACEFIAGALDNDLADALMLTRI